MENNRTFVSIKIRSKSPSARLPDAALQALSKISRRSPRDVEALLQAGAVRLPKVAQNEQLDRFVQAITRSGFHVDISPLKSSAPAHARPTGTAPQEPSEGCPDQTTTGFLTDLTIANWREGDLIEGLYEIRGSASGGMGRVYFVFHRVWKMMLAIKTPLAQAVRSETSLMRFLREAELWVDVGLHPNIATCYYARVIGGLPRLFIEYVDGGNLEDLIEQRKLTSLKAVCDLMIQFCHGMIHAQEKGMIHRDVKPANCLLSRDGDLKITDFGLVKRLGTSPLAAAQKTAEMTEDTSCGPDITAIEGGVMGSPLYMAPERFLDGVGDDIRSDVYSFGVMFYRAVLGRLPYNFPGGLSLKSVLRSHVHSAPVDPLKVNANLPRAVVDIMMTCLNKNPADRYPSFCELSEALERFWKSQWPSRKVRRRPDVLGLKADSLNNHAVSLLDLGKEDEARRLLEDAHSADPDHLQAVYNLYALRWMRAEASDIEVVNRMNSLRIEARETPDHRHLMGLVMLQRGAVSQAAPLLKSACEEAAHYRERWSDFPGGPDGFIASLGLRPIEERTVFGGHVKKILALGFTPNAEKAVSVGEDRSIRVWDTASARCLKTIRTVSFTPVAACVSADASLAATSYGGAYRTIDVWDLSRGVSLRKMKDMASVSAAFSWDATRLVCVSESGAVHLMSVSEGKTLWTRPAPHSPATCAIFLKGTRRVICGFADGTLSALDEDDGTELQRISAHEGPVSCLDYSETDQAVLSGGIDETVRIFKADTGRLVRKLLGHQGPITAVHFFRQAKFALSASEDGSIKTWNVRTGRCVRTLDISPEGATACAAAPDGKALLCGDAKGAVRLWSYDAAWFDKDFLDPALCRPRTFRELSELQRGFEEAVREFKDSWNSGDRGGACAGFVKMTQAPGYSWSREAILARIALTAKSEAQGPVSATFIRSLRGHSESVCALAASANGLLLVTAAMDGTVAVWDVVTGDILARIDAGRPVRAIWSLGEGGEILTVDEGARLRVWGKTGAVVREIDGVRPPYMLDANAGIFRALSSEGAPLQLNLRDGARTVGEVRLPREAPACFDRSGSHIYMVRDKTRIQRWSVATGRYEGAFRDVGVKVTSLAVSKDHARVIAGLDSGEIAVCRVGTTVDISILRGHRGPVKAAAPGPRPHLCVTGGDDCTLRLWDIVTGKTLVALEGHSSPVRSALFMPTGVMIAGGATDGTVRLWGLDWPVTP
jgi:WD40 repeat protein/serine/threonine protein kinase